MKKIKITKKQWKIILPIRILAVILTLPFNIFLHLLMIIGKIPELLLWIGGLGVRGNLKLNDKLINLFIYIITKFSENKRIEVIEDGKKEIINEEKGKENENQPVVNR